jgi:hypothetical protein
MYAMKELKRKTLLILGLIIATIALVNNFSIADTIINREDLNVELQVEQIAIDLNNSNVENKISNPVFKVYNSSDELVYETKNRKDKKLAQLMKTSDFLAEVNKISYYKLSR